MNKKCLNREQIQHKKRKSSDSTELQIIEGQCKSIALTPFLLILLNLLITSFTFAGSIIKDFEFPANTIKVDNRDSYSLVSLPGCDLTTQEVGKPTLPYANLNILIPASAEITGVEILDTNRIEIPGEFLLYPAQPPIKTSDQTERPFSYPDQATYQLSSEYPAKMNEIIPSGNKSEYRIGGVFLYPLKYIPAEKKLILYERIKIRINYEERRHEVGFLTEDQKQLFSREVKDLVINPEDISRFSPQTRVSDNPDADYIILTSTSLEPRFAPMVNWLRKTGIWADTFNTTWVYAHYTGYDNAEKIRKFIIDYYTNHGLKYILLAGDISVIPKRGAYAIVNTSPATIDSLIPCDLYYFDMQYSWDGNGNHIYGDTWTISGRKDTVDLYYDVYGGRWPVETNAEVDTLIRKYMTYVKNPDTLYEKRMLLPYGYLWSGYSARTSEDSIANFTPTGWTDRYIANTQVVNEVRDSLNNGFGFCHMVGHGNEQGVYWTSTGPDMYTTNYSHPSSQTNYNKLVIANSNACYSGSFDYSAADCLAEEMLKARGSAIAVMMNSRYGWGYTTQIGPSELLDVRFYHFLFSRDSVRMANCHQASKQVYRNSAMSDLCWRWCYYELNLFGEPSMMVWKDNPKKVVAKFSSTIYTGSQIFAVTCSSQSTVLSGATVCLWKGSEVYTKGTTNASGQVSLSISPATIGYMYVTITAKNKFPYEDSSLISLGHDFGVTAIEYPTGSIDSTGSTIIPRARVKNYGGFTDTATVTFRIINTSYTSSRTKILNAGFEDTVNFTAWTPVRGIYTTRCSTYRLSDALTSNDTLSSSVTVTVKDIGLTAIEYPTGSIDSTSSIIPRARVKNYGSSNETFNVTCRIVGTSYNQTRSKTLSAGAEDTVNFTTWLPIRGTYTTRCSVYLSTDVMKTNDTLGNTFTVQVKDVGVTAIENPAGSIDSTSLSVIPRARIKNYGTNSAAFNVTFKIGSSYTNTRAKTISAGIEDTVNFTSWIPVRGTQTLRCSTSLSNDVVKANDTLSSFITVQVKDVGVTQIVVPSGNIDSTGSITPQVKIKNFGTNSVSFNVALKIGTDYTATRSKMLGSGVEDTVNFLAWQPIRGTYPTRCSTFLANDVVPGNDTLSGSFRVVVHDVGVAEIIQPVGIIDTNATIIPKAKMRNFGNNAEIFNVRYSITGPVKTNWSDDTTVTVNATDSMIVNFTPWTIGIRGNYTTRCSTYLVTDMGSSNNVLAGVFTVQVKDFTVTRVSQPYNLVDSGVTTYPKAVIHNCGTTDENNVPVVLYIIGTSYADTQQVSLASGDSTEKPFADFLANVARGNYTIRCTTKLIGDTVAGNNLATKEFAIRVRDVGVVEIIQPIDSIDSTTTSVIPKAKIKNFGTNPENFSVIFSISGLGWSSTKAVSNLNAGAEQIVEFDPWTIGPRGNYTVKCSTELSNDMYPENNTLQHNLVVLVDTILPETPILISPINDVWLTNTSVVFNWTTVLGFDIPSPVRYILQVDTTTNFTTPISDTTSLVFDTVNLTQAHYYWRVRAYDLTGNQGVFSTYDSFGIDNTAPSVPNLISPINNASLADSFVQFYWNHSSDNVSGVNNYWLQVANDSNFTSPIDTTTSDTTITMILRNIKYWHVKAIDQADNASNWSLRRLLTVTGI
jgi:hypothetical protein